MRAGVEEDALCRPSDRGSHPQPGQAQTELQSGLSAPAKEHLSCPGLWAMPRLPVNESPAPWVSPRGQSPEGKEAPVRPIPSIKQADWVGQR
ncbi:hypothetical protein lerEdw1_009561 [Lerista edwardsae]|nr:hypothetical protein lerEdw1_009561 [Lerista edwardsae]